MSTLLELQGVSKAYDGRPALRPTSLAISASQTTVLIGPSGCGKSTILRLLLGLIHPDSGIVRFDGTQVRPDNALALRRRMGYVVQDGGLFPHLTAQENIVLLTRYLGWTEPRFHVRLEQLIDLTHFPVDGLDRYPVQLSGGQRQRVGLMRALMLDPDVLLLDEPLGALDPIVRSDLQADLRRIFRALGKTVVLVTHDLSEAGFFGDNLVLLRDGQIVQQGTLDDLTQRPADPFVTQFINAQRHELNNTAGGGR
jgi:osmoprotectant transport system ATP-binding protein